MDITPRSSQLGPSSARTPLAFQPDHVAELTRALHGVEGLVGHPVLMGGGGVGIEVERARLVQISRALRDDLGFEMLTSVSGVDMRDHLEVVYHLRSLSRNWLLQMKVALEPGNPQVDSLVGVWLSANWLERETYDLFGSIFVGHPDLRRILLDDEFEGYPLLKSFHQTPMTVHDRATTQVAPEEALSGEAQRGVERVVSKRLGQGTMERLHPGTPTFGDAHYPDQPGVPESEGVD
ncbi:MAG TPA: NADH-quinone oxidoreductase subunit C [Ktedonobacterales bacterium]|nr:NADH-quinone oxidoreductase subunit C [Ktedonobacterales bacterium]